MGLDPTPEGIGVDGRPQGVRGFGLFTLLDDHVGDSVDVLRLGGQPDGLHLPRLDASQRERVIDRADPTQVENQLAADLVDESTDLGRVAEVSLRVGFLEQLFDEVLLHSLPAVVGVVPGVSFPHDGQRVVGVVASASLLVVAAVGGRQVLRQAQFDPAEGGDDVEKAFEVDDGDPVETDPGELGDGVGKVLGPVGGIGPTVGVGGIDLVPAGSPGAAIGDVDEKVAGDGHQVGVGEVGVDVEDHDGVGPGGFAGVDAQVGADQQHVQGAVDLTVVVGVPEDGFLVDVVDLGDEVLGVEVGAPGDHQQYGTEAGDDFGPQR